MRHSQTHKRPFNIEFDNRFLSSKLKAPQVHKAQKSKNIADIHYTGYLTLM